MTPSDEQYERARRLFDELRGLDVDAQRRKLAACEDVQVRTYVGVLLSAGAWSDEGIFDTTEDPRAESPEAIPSGADPTRIGPYQILRRIGAGSMGIVYEALQDHPHRRVALKIIPPGARTDAALSLFRFEVQAVGQINHPGVPQVYEAGQVDGYTYLVMELVHGLPLDEYAARNGLGVSQRLNLLARVADAVAVAHREGVLHRDLKPANILVTADGQPKILDFGIATSLLQTRSLDMVRAGTPTFMSPEQLQGESVDERSDVFALGVIGWLLVYGVLPHRARVDRLEMWRAKMTPPRSGMMPLPGMPPDAERVLRRALSPQVKDRTPSASSFAEDVRAAARLQPLPWGGGGLYRLSLWRHRHRTSVNVGLVVAGLTGFVGGMVLMAHGFAEVGRASRAREHLASAQEALDQAAFDGDWEEAEHVFRAYVGAPEHEGTPSVAQAWIDHARRLEHHGGPNALGTWGVAYGVATEPARRAEALDSLARAFSERWMSQSLVQLHRSHGDELDPSLRADVVLAHVAERLVADALALAPADHPDRPILRELSGMTDLGTFGRGATLIDLDGDDERELIVTSEEPYLRVWNLTPRVELWRNIQAPGPQEKMWSELLVTIDERLFAVSRHRTTGRSALWRWRGERDDGWDLVAELGGGTPQVAFHGQVGGRDPALYVLFAYPERVLLEIDPDTGEVRKPAPWLDALDSDYMDGFIGDVDLDGETELVLGMGHWTAYDVRILGGGPGPELTLQSAHFLGPVYGVEPVQIEGGSTRILASKVNAYEDLRVFSQAQPYGQPPGLFLMDVVGGELDPVTRLPVPAVDRDGPAVEIRAPVPLDIDGDGVGEQVWNITDVGHHGDIWLVTGLDGDAPREFVLQGLRALTAGDLDGDGDEELVVADEDWRLWVLGMGDDQVAAFGGHQTDVGWLRDALREVSDGQGIGRALELAELGLPSSAAQALSLLASRSKAEDQYRMQLAAGRIWENLGEHEEAEHAYRVAADIDEGPEPREGLIRAHTEQAEMMEARSLVSHLPAERRGAWSWLSALPLQKPVELFPHGSAAAAAGGPVEWALREAGLVWSTEDGGWHAMLPGDLGVLMERPVRWVGPWLDLDLSAVFERVEQGTGVYVELVDEAGSRVAGIGVLASGGGAATRIHTYCGGSFSEMLEPIGGVGYPPGRLGLRMVVTGHDQPVRCQQTGPDGTTVMSKNPVIIPRGDYTLRVSAPLERNRPARMITEVSQLSLKVGGLELLPIGASSAGERVILSPQRLGHVVPPVQERIWLATHDYPAGMTQAIRLLHEMGDNHKLSWLLRRELDLTAPLAAEVLGEDFAQWYAETWLEAVRQYPHDDRAADAVSRPEMAYLRATSGAQARVMIHRAEVMLDRGYALKAQQIADDVVIHAPLADPMGREAVARAHLLLARIHNGAEPPREGEARQEVLAYRQVVGSGVEADNQLERLDALHGL